MAKVTVALNDHNPKKIIIGLGGSPVAALSFEEAKALQEQLAQTIIQYADEQRRRWSLERDLAERISGHAQRF